MIQQPTAVKRSTLVLGSRKLLFHEETLSSTDKTQFALAANSLSGETLCETLEKLN